MTAMWEPAYRTSVRTWSAVVFSAVLAVGLGADTARAQTSNDHDRNAAGNELLILRADHNGYLHGFSRGASDVKAGLGNTSYLDLNFLHATTGYAVEMGSFADYQVAFRKAYARGYADAHSGRDRDAVMNDPPAPPEPDSFSEIGVARPGTAAGDFLSVATAKGYDAGYTQGAADRRRGGGYSYRDTETYRIGTEGYDASLGEESRYQLVFRLIYARGYSDGFNDRTRYTEADLHADEDQPVQALSTGSRTEIAGFGADDHARQHGAVGSSPATRRAAESGYHAGHERGLNDARMGMEKASPQVDGAYQLALDGWEPGLGDRSAYQQEFRKSFVLGYDEGFGRGAAAPTPRP